MKKSTVDNLSPHLFWDIKHLNPEQNKTIIIERVFNRGNLDDLKIIINIFGLETIKTEIVKAGFLDKKTLNWASFFLNIPETNFRCYKKIQSTKTHWSY